MNIILSQYYEEPPNLVVKLTRANKILSMLLNFPI